MTAGRPTRAAERARNERRANAPLVDAGNESAETATNDRLGPPPTTSRPQTDHPGSPRPEPTVELHAPAPRPQLANSPVRRIVGRPIRDAEDAEPRGPAPASVRELAFIDRINEVKEPQHQPPSDKLPRLYDADYAILALLDRAGLVPPSLIGRAALHGKEPKTVRHRLNKLYEHGLVARAGIGVRERSSADGRLPWLYTLTRHGLDVAQQRTPPAVHPQREWRALEQRRAGTLPHNLHALAWAIELHRVVGDLATDYWRTPRYATGRYPVPQIGNGHKRHPITMRELDVPDGHAILDLPPFREIKPDVSLELRVPSLRLTFDLMLELDLTGRPSYNREKFLAYDSFLTGWALEHPRYRTLGTRPVVVFVCRDAPTALSYAQEADRSDDGRIGAMGTRRMSGTTPGATTSSSRPNPIFTTAAWAPLPSRHCRPQCATSSRALTNLSLGGWICSRDGSSTSDRRISRAPRVTWTARVKPAQRSLVKPARRNASASVAQPTVLWCAKIASVFLGIGDEPIRHEIRAAHDAALADALGYLERHAAIARRGPGGAVSVQGIGVSSPRRSSTGARALTIRS